MPSDDPSREELPPSGALPPQGEQRQLGPTGDELADIPFVVPVEADSAPSIPYAQLAEPGAASAIPFAQLLEPDSAYTAIPPAEPPVPEIAAAAPRPPHPGFWWSALWTLVFAILLNGVIVGASMVVLVVRVALENNPREYLTKLRSNAFQGSEEYDQLLAFVAGPSLLLGELISVAFALIMIRLIVGPHWKRLLALRRPRFLHLVLVLLGFPGLLHLSSGVELLAKYVELPTFHAHSDFPRIFAQWPWWFGVLVIGLGPGLSEELWCRGFLGRGLVGRYGPVLGVLITSFFFGCMHADPPLVVTTAVMGLWLHFTYLLTRSLLVPMLLHFLNNSLAFLGVLYTHLQSNSSVSDDTPQLLHLGRRAFTTLRPLLDPTERTSDIVYAYAILSLLAVGWALYQSRVRLVPSPQGGQSPWQPDFPGVALPPPQSSTTLAHPWPGWSALVLVVITLLFFGWLAYVLWSP